MKQNFVGKILGKIKIFVQDFVPIRTALRRSIFPEIFGRAGSKIFLENTCLVHDLKISNRLLQSKLFLKTRFLVLYAAYFVVCEEGME